MKRLRKYIIENEVSYDYGMAFYLVWYLVSSTSFFPDIVKENDINL